MKIGIYDPYLDSLGGGEKYMLTAASCLSKEHTVSIFWDNSSVRDLIHKRFAIDLSQVRFTENIFSPTYPFFKRLIKSKKYDYILYLSDGSIPFVASQELILHFQFPIEWVDTTAYVYRLKRARVSEIIVNSAFTKKYIDRKFNLDSKIVYPPIDTDSLQGKHKKEKIILTVGRYNPLPDGTDFKKHEFLIHTFKKLVDAGVKDWKFIVAISFQERDAAAVTTLEAKIGDYPISIKKNVVHQTLLSYYKEASIYWHASGYQENLTLHPERAEHFGIATVEAMSAGAVPVVINAGGQKEIVKDEKNGYLWETETELLHKTNELINNPEKLKRYSQESIASSMKFNAEAFCTSLQDIINAQ